MGNIFNIHIEDMLDIQEVVFEIYIEDKLTNRQQMRASKDMIIANFIQTIKQARNDKRPIKIRMTKPEVIWDNFENRQKVLDNEVAFSNNAMLAWEESNDSSTK